jgi:phage shock protein PspC (stress-responsive transcriptional regulator)
MEQRRLTRSRTDKFLGGVCGGIAAYIGWDSASFRWMFVLLSIFSAAFPGMLVYVLLWIFMPLED